MDEMQRLAELGADLSPAEVPVARLRARASATAAARGPAARSRWVRPSLVAASVLTLAAGTALVANATAGSGAGHRQAGTPPGAGAPVAVRPAAFTVTKNADGSVTFTMHELMDLAGATRALNDAGIVGRVVTSTEDCTTGPNAVPVNPADLYPPDTVHRLGDHGKVADGDTVTVRSSDYPPGGGLLLTVSRDVLRDGTSHLIVVYFAYVDAAKIPTCVNFIDPGTGAWPSGQPK